MGIVEGLFWPVLAAALIGLVALAIREPVKFRKISKGLFFTGAALTMLAVVGIGAYENGAREAFAHLSNGGTPASFESPFYMGPFLPMVLYFVWTSFVYGLEWLGKYLANDEDSEPTKQ